MKKLATLLFVVCFVPVWFILACIAMSIGAITYLVKIIDKCIENAFRCACVLLLRQHVARTVQSNS